MSSSIDAPTALVHGSSSSSEEHLQTLNMSSHQDSSMARRLRRMKRRLFLDYASQEGQPHQSSSSSAMLSSSSLSSFDQEVDGSNGSSIIGERSLSDSTFSSSSLDGEQNTIIEEVSATRILRRLKRKLLLEYASQPILSQH